MGGIGDRLAGAALAIVIAIAAWPGVAGAGDWRDRKTIEAVLHPERYTAFVGIEDPDAFERAWETNKPWVLANLAHAAYFDEDKLCALLAPFLRAANPCEPTATPGPPRLHVYSNDGSQGYLAVWPDKAVLVFRGTEVHSHTDLLADADFILQEPLGEARVHRGYLRELNKIWPNVSRDLETYRELPPIPIWVTGHSMGAAMATLAGMRGIPFEAIITFGEPRVGLNIASAFMAKRHVRYVNGYDPAIHYPFPIGYEHHGEKVEIVDPDGPRIFHDHAIVYYSAILGRGMNE